MITCYQYLFQQNRLTLNVPHTLPTVRRVREIGSILECHPICVVILSKLSLTQWHRARTITFDPAHCLLLNTVDRQIQPDAPYSLTRLKTNPLSLKDIILWHFKDSFHNRQIYESVYFSICVFSYRVQTCHMIRITRIQYGFWPFFKWYGRTPFWYGF